MNNLKEKIKESYTDVVTGQTAGCCTPASGSGSACCGTVNELTVFQEDYRSQPGYVPEADYGLGCGIPVAFAGIEEGQTVLDLGSGAGNDVFVARSLTGPSGKVIGVDMTPAMIEKANHNKAKLGYDNVEFILGDIEALPLPDHSVDTVISNCVLNLVPDKLTAYREIHRVLKSTGHFTISDVVVSGPLSRKMEGITELYAGCIAGAMVKAEYLETIRQAGFQGLAVKAEKTIHLPDDFLLQYLSAAEVARFRESGVQVLSLTVYGQK